MGKTYKIQAVSTKVDNWSNEYGDFSTYHIKLEGQEADDEVVQLNKKSDSPAPQAGDEIYGDLTGTKFGIKFKSEKKPFGGQASLPLPSGSTESRDTQDSIDRSVVLKASVDLISRVAWKPNKSWQQDTLDVADEFLEWLQNTGSPSRGEPTSPPATNEAKSQPASDPDPEWSKLDVPEEWK